MLTHPCTECPIHLAGVEKGGPCCMQCDARIAYCEAVEKGLTHVDLPPHPVGAMAEATAALRDYAGPKARPQIGPYKRDRQKRAGETDHSRLRRNLLIARRVEKGLTQEALANILNTSQKTISNLENGLRMRPNLMVRKNLEQFFDLPVEELLRAGDAAAR
jgi:DNA-binding XRE family transcriptional regulator